MNKRKEECSVCYVPLAEGEASLGGGKWVCGDDCFKAAAEKSSKGRTKNSRARQGLGQY